MLEVKGDYNKLTEEMGKKMVETAVSPSIHSEMQNAGAPQKTIVVTCD